MIIPSSIIGVIAMTSQHNTSIQEFEDRLRSQLKEITDRLCAVYHLSPDEETAINVGSRHGKPYVIKIDCQKMLADGCKFFLSNNGVWLTEMVLPEYFCE